MARLIRKSDQPDPTPVGKARLTPPGKPSGAADGPDAPPVAPLGEPAPLPSSPGRAADPFNPSIAPPSRPVETTSNPAGWLAGLALALAVIALLASLGILPFAKVTNARLQNDAVTSEKVQDRSLSADDFGIGSLPKGPRGPAGPPGKPGPAGAIGTEQVKKTSASNSDITRTVEARCPEGKRVVGGGTDVENGAGQVLLASNAPLDSGDGWRGVAVEVADYDEDWALNVFAICAASDDKGQGEEEPEEVPALPVEPVPGEEGGEAPTGDPNQVPADPESELPPSPTAPKAPRGRAPDQSQP